MENEIYRETGDGNDNGKEMRILFINHKDVEGGAAIAATRVAHRLEKSFGTENYFIVAKKCSSAANVFATIGDSSETRREIKVFIEFMVNKVLNFLGMQYYYFPFSSRAIMKLARRLKPDIISLHNTHGGYFKTTLIKKLSKLAPVVWTLHDMWSFTANGAHTFGDESWKQMKSGEGEKKIYPHIGIDRGASLLKRKRRIYRKSDLHVIGPSRWICDLAKQSPVFEKTPVHHIFHGLDREVFRPAEKSACRQALGIDRDARVLIFCSADDLDRSAWKGGSLLVDILTAIDAKTPYPIETLVLGKGELTALQGLTNIELRKMGYVDSPRLVAMLLSAADVFIYPTRADTMPLVLLEAVSCGTPCVTFDIGGCGDIVRDGVSGYLLEPFDVEGFADRTLDLLGDPEELEEVSRTAQQLADEQFNIKTQAEAYHQLYSRIIDDRNKQQA
jgi:glycosyltransferase involved in cell wall biosynthesis